MREAMIIIAYFCQTSIITARGCIRITRVSTLDLGEDLKSQQTRQSEVFETYFRVPNKPSVSSTTSSPHTPRKCIHPYTSDPHPLPSSTVRINSHLAQAPPHLMASCTPSSSLSSILCTYQSNSPHPLLSCPVLKVSTATRAGPHLLACSTSFS